MTAPLRIAVIGDGRMGRAVSAAAAGAGDVVTAVIGRGTPITWETLAGADVAIDFTTPDAAPGNVKACVDARCPVVVGTTGWDAAVPDVERHVAAHHGAMLRAANFSLGVLAFGLLVREAARAARSLPALSALLVETHHAAKLDAPSGTARALAAEWAGVRGETLPVTSIRLGSVPGTHELVLDLPHEQLLLRHEVRDRRVFAAGAIAAAHWLPGRTGIFTLADVFDVTGDRHA